MIKIANRTREIRLSGMKRGACGNVMHGLASFCHEAGNGGNNGRRCPKHARTVFLPDLDSINWVRIEERISKKPHASYDSEERMFI